MYCTQIEKNTTYYLEVFLTDSNGEPVEGITVEYSIYDCSTNNLIDSGTLNDIGGGVYQKAYTFTNLGQFRVIYNTPSGYTDGIETILVVAERAKEETLKRILGLTQENYRLFNPVYDEHDNLTSATIRIYPTATDCQNDTNPIATYKVESFYDNQGRLIDYRVRRIS